MLYFATPHIISEDITVNSKNLTELYKIYFIEGFKKIVEDINSGKTLNILYPSTVYIDSSNNKYKKYATIKKQGEKLCQSLMKLYPNIKIIYPRLPRLRTDLTASLINRTSLEANSYLLDIYKKWT